MTTPLRRLLCACAAIAAGMFMLPHFVSIGEWRTEITGGYEIVQSNANDVVIIPVGGYDDETPIVPTKVIECDFDQRFIIAKRQVLENGRVPAPEIVDFWILDVGESKGFGPLLRSEFDAKRQELGVPDSLKLKNVKSFDR